MKLKIIIYILIFSSFIAYSGVMNDSITKYELGVRANGMGDAFTALSDDPSAVLYNPAGLNSLNYKSALFVHTDKYGIGINNDLFVYSMPWKDKNISFGYLQESIDGIPQTDASKAISGMLDVSRSMFSMSVAGKTNSLGKYGVSLKMLSSDLAGFEGSGYSLDFGLIRNINRKYKAGIVVQDIISNFEWDSGTEDTIPLTLKAGVSYISRLKDLKINLDIVNEEKGDSYMSLGGEYSLNNIFTLRAGYKDGNIAMGFGLNYDDWTFDYARIDDDFDVETIISATMNLKKLVTSIDRDIERHRDGKIIRKAEKVPQIRNGEESHTYPASDAVNAVLDRYSGKSNKIKKADKEIEMKKKALEIPEEAKMHYKLGNTFLIEEIYTKAVEEYKKAIQIYPQYSQAHYNLAALYDKMGMHEKAIYEYQLAIQIDPYNVNAYVALGNLYTTLNNVDEAIKYYNKVIIVAPGSKSAELSEKKIKSLKE